MRILGFIVSILMIIFGIYFMIKIIINFNSILDDPSDDFAPIAAGLGLFGLSLVVGIGFKILIFCLKWVV